MARRSKQIAAPPAETRKNLRKLDAIAERFGMWRPAAEVLVPVRGVRTIFPWVDMTTRIGAWPIERVCTVHGPSNEGKTAFSNGLGLSFLMRDHFYALIDAEQTTPITWLAKLMQGFASHPRFLAMRPRTYENAVGAVRQFCDSIGDMKAKGEIEPDTSGLVVVDSIRKLSPKKLLDQLLKEEKEDAAPKKRGRRGGGPKGVDGAGGRAAQIKAALNAQWLDELVPLTAQTGTSVLLIARELADDDDDPWGRNVKVTGGKALIYDAALVARIVRAQVLYDGDGPGATYYGERHRVELRKTKIGKKEERTPTGYFTTTNGAIPGIPEGFDRGRDLVQLGVEQGSVKQAGSWYSFNGRRLGQGEHAAARRVTEDASLFTEIEEATRATFELEGAP